LSGLGMPDEALPQWLWEATGVNQSIVDALGININLPWALAGPGLALVAVSIYNIWVLSGYNALIFMAGLGGIPVQMYEAAKIDGAGRWSTLRYVTLPLLSPTTFFLTMMGVIGAFKAVSHIYVMTQQVGLTGPQFTTATNTIYIWDRFRVASQYGYASALAFILFGIILTLTRIQNEVQGARVHYG
jgi:multiple sugar transport system permease protein